LEFYLKNIIKNKKLEFNNFINVNKMREHVYTTIVYNIIEGKKAFKRKVGVSYIFLHY